MDREMGLGQHDRAPGAALLRSIESVELVKMVAEDREPHVLARAHAKVLQLFSGGEQLALLAVVEIGNDMQSLHFDTPFQAKVRIGGTVSRDLGRFANGGTPSNPGRRVESFFLQRFTQAKNIAVKKCASIIA